ncbi:MAG TPA: acyl carrier protein [Chloroflexota bacterium]|nr:acyl carrier protein [Chloroflexota bacterium]
MIDPAERVRTVLSEVLDLDPGQIDGSTSIDTVEAWDSLKQLTLILALEEEFGFRFTDEEATQLVSFRLIEHFVRARLAPAV